MQSGGVIMDGIFHNVPHPKGVHPYLDTMFETYGGFRRSIRKALRRSSKLPAMYTADLDIHTRSKLFHSYVQSFND